MNLMIDLETLGINEDCPVISIGACTFTKEGINCTFSANLDINQQIEDGRKVKGNTIKWWMEQENAAQQVFKQDAKGVKEALNDFHWFVTGECGVDAKPWGNGATFDISILTHLMRQYEIQPPWQYYNVRDLRTFKEYVYDGKDLEREGTHHNALDDACHQAKIVVEGMKRCTKWA